MKIYPVLLTFRVAISQLNLIIKPVETELVSVWHVLSENTPCIPERMKKIIAPFNAIIMQCEKLPNNASADHRLMSKYAPWSFLTK